MSAQAIQNAAARAVEHLIATGDIAHANAIKRLILARINSAAATSSFAKDIWVYRVLLHRARDLLTRSASADQRDDLVARINAALDTSAPGKFLPDATTAGQDNA